jgi:hypothetical protein
LAHKLLRGKQDASTADAIVAWQDNQARLLRMRESTFYFVFDQCLFSVDVPPCNTKDSREAAYSLLRALCFPSKMGLVHFVAAGARLDKENGGNHSPAVVEAVQAMKALKLETCIPFALRLLSVFVLRTRNLQVGELFQY